MQEEIKQPMTIEELMGDVKRQAFTLANGKAYDMKNPGELTPNQRRDLNKTIRDINTPGKFDMEGEIEAFALVHDLIFVEDIPVEITDNTAPDTVDALVGFFYNRTPPEQVIDRLTQRIRELTEQIEQSNGDTSEVESAMSTA